LGDVLRKRATELTGWLDYDRPDLPFLDKRERLSYFWKRIDKVLLGPLEDMLAEVLEPNSPNDTLLCFATCLCCGIEALGAFWTGNYQRGNSEKNFRAFVTAHMDSRYSRRFRQRTYLDVLWNDFRNGLAHGFTARSGTFQEQRNYFRVDTIKDDTYLILNHRLLFEDFDHAAKSMVHTLRQSQETSSRYQNFHRTFDAIFVQGQ
jgi:hypothetical protein